MLFYARDEEMCQHSVVSVFKGRIKNVHTIFTESGMENTICELRMPQVYLRENCPSRPLKIDQWNNANFLKHRNILEKKKEKCDLHRKE